MNRKDKDICKRGAVMQDFCHSENFEMLQYLRHSESLEKYYEPANSYFRMQNFCNPEYYEIFQYLRHSESLEKCYEFTNSYFSCYSESINANENPIKLDRFRISGTRIKRISASPYILCSCLSGMTDNTGLLRPLSLTLSLEGRGLQ